MKIHKINSLGVKKIPAVPVPDRPYFFCRPYYFFNAIDRATLFSPGGCGLLPNGVCCHTNYWKNHEKNIQKKIISDLPTLIFSRYETGTTGIFLRLTASGNLCALDASYFIILLQTITIKCKIILLIKGRVLAGVANGLINQTICPCIAC
jgi:hypothetical protein